MQVQVLSLRLYPILEEILYSDTVYVCTVYIFHDVCEGIVNVPAVIMWYIA